MEFDTETELETFYKLFGADTSSASEFPCWAGSSSYSNAAPIRGPVWVYVLARRFVVPVLLSILPSLNGAVIGTISESQAETLIPAPFVPSPPFPASDLPSVASDGEFDFRSVRSVNSGMLEAFQLGLETPLPRPHSRTPSLPWLLGWVWAWILQHATQPHRVYFLLW